MSEPAPSDGDDGGTPPVTADLSLVEWGAVLEPQQQEVQLAGLALLAALVEVLSLSLYILTPI